MAAPIRKAGFALRRCIQLRKTFCSAVENISEQAVKPVKEPLRQRIVAYFKRMYDDYKFSTKETVTLYKEKPIRMSIYTSLAVVTSYLFSHNPSMDDYEGHLATMTCDLAEVGDDIRNEEKSKQVQMLLSYQTRGRLRRFTLGVCSFIWISDYPTYIDLYEAHCKEVKMTWREWPQYIVDVGFLGRWLWSEKYMVDFDINPKEWAHLEKTTPVS